MRTTILAVLLFASCCFAQDPKNLTASSEFDAAVGKGVKIEFSYAIPADDPLLKNAAMFPAQTPTRIQWHWGDEAESAGKKNYSEAVHASVNKMTHVYKPGNYTMVVTITDTKGRLVIQDSMRIKVSLPVEFNPPLR